VLSREGPHVMLRVTERELPAVIGELLSLKVGDLAIEDPPLEDVLRVMFGRHKAEAARVGDAP
jgi:hypothetical protein